MNDIYPNHPPTPFGQMLRYVHTLRHLKPIQIAARFRPRLGIGPQVPLTCRTITGEWSKPILKSDAQLEQNRFRFVNQERDITSWNDCSASRLWLYNLHYFDYVDDGLVNRWISENPVGQGIGWDPYPTSLRVANWCKWILDGADPAPAVYASLSVQASWIERRLERHLLAHHILANAKALIFVGALFEIEHAARWLSLGLRILQEELPRQILPDGAHAERSPMYHSIVLEDVLDLCNLRSAFHGILPDLSETASRMLGWLEQMTHPDGGISFFNDAALGIAPRQDALQSYARRMGIFAERVILGESGYRRISNGKNVVIFDAAPLGPDYQPGHGHADALSFEFSRNGRRVLVNSGTSTYDEGPVRAFERGTAAHNTIRIDGVDQSEMWGSFRVARRARTFDVRSDGRTFAEAAHDGYRRLRHKLVHRRRIELSGDTLTLRDWLEGRGQHRVEMFFHFAPGTNPAVQFDPAMTTEVGSSVYSPGFNLAVPNRTLIGHWSGPCPVSFVTRIRLSDTPDSSGLSGPWPSVPVQNACAHPFCGTAGTNIS